MKKLLYIITAVALAAGSVAASAQTPAFREKGYKGNVGLQTIELLPIPITSHGYMFNQTHYLGVGVGAIYFSSFAVYPFIEYQAYLLKRNSTPVLGVKLSNLLLLESSPNFHAGISPSFGWSWGIGSRRQFGIMPYLGCDVFYCYHGPTKDSLFPNPFLGVVFEF